MNDIFVRGDTQGDFNFLPQFYCEYDMNMLIILRNVDLNFYSKNSIRERQMKIQITNTPIILFRFRGDLARDRAFINLWP